MSTHKWATPESVTTLLSTELNSAARDSVTVSGLIDNSTGMYKYADFEVYVSQAGDLGTFCSIYLLEALDGTNYEEAATSPDTGETLLLAAQLAGHVRLDNKSGFQRHLLRQVPLLPTKFKVLFFPGVQAAGLAASGNTVKMIRYNEADVA